MAARNWSEAVTAATRLAYALQPRVVTGPGEYETRGGRTVRIHTVAERGLFCCEGVHDCGTPDRWPLSGRIFPTLLSEHDLVRKLGSS